MIDLDALEEVIKRTAERGGEPPPVYVSADLYRELKRIESEGWEPKYIDCSAMGWYYVREWDKR
jgi:hypothetical protein